MAIAQEDIPIYSKLNTSSTEEVELLVLKDKTNSEDLKHRRISHGMRSTDHLTLRNELLQAARDGMDETFSELIQFICTNKHIRWCRSGSDLTGEKMLFPNIDNLLNSSDTRHHTILHYAARYNRYNILTALLKHGGRYNVNFDVRTDSGYTPLHYAARYISVEQEKLRNREVEWGGD